MNNPAPKRGQKPSSSLDASRKAALETLVAVAVDDAYANLLLPKKLKNYQLSGRDAAFATELTYGTARASGVLDLIIQQCSTRNLSSMDPEVLAVLRMGAYQHLHMRVDTHAAVDTTVNAVAWVNRSQKLRTAKNQKQTTAIKGFVNAVMRKLTKKSRTQWLDEIAPDRTQDPVGYLAMLNNHPRWIAEAFALSLGTKARELSDALAADDARPIVHLAAKPGEITAEELALIVGGEQGNYSPSAVYLPSGDPGELAPVQQGLAVVQDEGSQLIARAVSAATLDGEDQGKWIDLCAGPGGKTAYLGAQANIAGATVDAVEIASHRAELVRNATRGLPVSVFEADGTKGAAGLRAAGVDVPEGGYDRILVDAPCSGLGALRRRPEARWRKSLGDLTELVTLQTQLLDAALEMVRVGGVVVYSTCSPHLRETRTVIDKALRRHKNFVEVDMNLLVHPMQDADQGLAVQMWPHRHGTDAMFLAGLRRTA